MEAKRDETDVIQEYLATHNSEDREQVVLRFIPLVHFVLGRLGISQSMGQDYEDAVSQGILGLIEAVDKFDPSHGTQFSTYATLRIRGKIIDYLRSHDWLSRGARHRARQMQSAISQLWEKNQREPTQAELAEFLNLDEAGFQQVLLDSSRMIVSLDTLISVDGEDMVSLHEVLPDETQIMPAELYEDKELKGFLMKTIAGMPEREQLVLALYYVENLTFKEIGAVLDVSESRICQLHARAVMSLRSKLHRHLFNSDSASYTPRPQAIDRPAIFGDNPAISLNGGVTG